MTKESGTVFALDVGTRSVVGIVGEYEDGLFITKAVEVVCHAGRAMFDGQIHSIPDVTRVVAEVRRRLEERLAIRLDKVLIAAAGRSLLTRGARARRILDPEREIDAEFILGMEIEALQAAQQEIDDDLAQSGGEAPHVPPGAGDATPPPMPERRARYFCVGYSTTRRVLDGYPISNLVGHSGNQAELEILGTFLPRAVVDSLYTVMRQAGLSVAGLTLEPIAALGAVVPPDLRRLNIALVDIGAGTSDIAITRDGDVFAYAMVAVAGDEITERICEYYLTDFHTGEAIKLALSSDQSEIRFKNALGREVVCTQDEVYQVVLPELERLSKMISDEILAYNKKVPSAVFLVGGGCQVPGFEQIFSATLGIDEGRVAIRDRSALENIRCEFDALSGPDAITPFGIAVGVDGGGGYGELMSVTLNGKKVRLLDIRRPTVADVISLTGIEPAKLSGRSGRALSFVLNGEPKTVRGESAVSAVITVNGRPAGLDTALNFGDEIRLTEARNGRDAKVYASDLAPGARVGTVYCDGRAFLIAPRLLINGAECALATEIKEEDRVLLNVDTTVARFTEEYMPETTSRGAAVNGVRVSPAYVLEPGDRLEFPQEAAPAAAPVSDYAAADLVLTAAREPELTAAAPEPVPEPRPAPEPSAASAFSLEFASADSPFVSGTADPVLPAAPELELTIAEPVPSEPVFDVAEPELELAAPEPSVALEAESVPESVSAVAPAFSLDFASAAVPVSEYAAAPAFSLESASLVDSVLALAPDLAPAPAPAPDTAPERTVSAELVVNGAMTTVCSNTSELLFLDVFNHIEIDRSNPNGHLRLMLNGAPANLTDRIKTGDQVEIAWTRD